ncbi:hypothetical protein SDC9_67666 [bioreactor metagenome]|uniref:Uncharacterized protein n=1 Tax=bioreactor metagenome TaxID=1076179 RepID=A0A644XY76_9ZZZZ
MVASGEEIAVERSFAGVNVEAVSGKEVIGQSQQAEMVHRHMHIMDVSGSGFAVNRQIVRDPFAERRGDAGKGRNIVIFAHQQLPARLPRPAQIKFMERPVDFGALRRVDVVGVTAFDRKERNHHPLVIEIFRQRRIRHGQRFMIGRHHQFDRAGDLLPDGPGAAVDDLKQLAHGIAEAAALLALTVAAVVEGPDIDPVAVAELTVLECFGKIVGEGLRGFGIGHADVVADDAVERVAALAVDQGVIFGMAGEVGLRGQQRFEEPVRTAEQRHAEQAAAGDVAGFRGPEVEFVARHPDQEFRRVAPVADEPAELEGGLADAADGRRFIQRGRIFGIAGVRAEIAKAPAVQQFVNPVEQSCGIAADDAEARTGVFGGDTVFLFLQSGFRPDFEHQEGGVLRVGGIYRHSRNFGQFPGEFADRPGGYRRFALFRIAEIDGPVAGDQLPDDFRIGETAPDDETFHGKSAPSCYQTG